MKKLLITGLLAFLIATTFLSDNPPGWFQQQLPLSNVTVQDIFFIDSLKGWVSAMKNSTNDTAYIFYTSDGGNNWTIQFKDSIRWINVVQFLDENTGYAGGGFGDPKFLKTTNGGNNWLVGTPPGLTNYSILDMKFVNKDTGWVCSDEDLGGGIFRTTNGGSSWQRQTGSFDAPIKLFFLNSDTGWSLSTRTLYKTTNSGVNWNLVSSFTSGLRGLFFLNNDTGWIIQQGVGQNGIKKTINGGVNWFVQSDPTPFGSVNEDIFIINNSKGWISSARFTILSLANDSTWGNQAVPLGFPAFYSIFMTDTNRGYSGGTIFVKTEDGGGVITNVKQNSEEVPSNFKLFQNYPNPFNPKTIINYELRITSYVKLGIYDIQGKELTLLVNQRQNRGEYKIEFDGSGFPSGVYFYALAIDGKIISGKMILSK
jgi:photosystem II stability/assembly factor-like uncharacterized protein